MYNKCKRFAKKSDLKQIRLARGPFFMVSHSKEGYPPTEKNKDPQKNCALCSTNKIERRTRYFCKLCEVPLCRSVISGVATSCWDAWYSVDDLEAEQQIRQEKVRCMKETRANGMTGRATPAAEGDMESDYVGRQGWSAQFAPGQYDDCVDEATAGNQGRPHGGVMMMVRAHLRADDFSAVLTDLGAEDLVAKVPHVQGAHILICA